jgi:hypothetical protein
VSAVLRSDHAAQGFPCRRKLVLELSHSALSNAVLRAAGITFSNETPVDSFEISDSSDELGALRAVDLSTELEPQPLLQLVVLGSQPLDLLTRKCKVDLQAGRCGVGLPSRMRHGLTATSGLDMLTNTTGVDEPGRHARRSGHGGECDRFTGRLEFGQGVERTPPLVLAVVGPGGRESGRAT